MRVVVQRPPTSAAALVSAVCKLPRDELESLLQGGSQMRVVIEAAAQMGLVRAQVQLGRMLLEGTDGTKDKPAAYRWFARATERGDADACNMLGRCHEKGWGVTIDFERAAACYRLSAHADDSWAQYNLGHLYLNGQGVRRDPLEALYWYRRSAALGHARAMNLVGRCYEQGWGCSRDVEHAFWWYRVSAEAGYFRGQFNHATLLMSLGQRAEARAWFERAIRQAPAPSREFMRQACEERWNIHLSLT